MRSFEFITEAEVKPYKSQVLEIEAAVALLNKRCKQSLAMLHSPLWRGMRNHNEPIISIDPRQGKRKSQNTTNYYTEIIDHNPYFKGWPKRSKSLICSSSQSTASGYAHGSGWKYAIFPYDRVLIAVCPEEDMWSTHVSMPGLGLEIDEITDDMSGFNRFLRYELGLSDSYPEMIRQLKSSRFVAALENVRARLSASQRRDEVTPETFLSYIQQRLSPMACGFRLLTVDQYAKSPPKNKECWVGGPVVAIREDIYHAFVNSVTQSSATNGKSAWPQKISSSVTTKKVPNKVNDEDEVSTQEVKYYADAGMRLTPEEYEYWKRARSGEFDVGDEDGEF